MAGAVGTLYRQDLVIAGRNRFFLFIGIVLVVSVAVVHLIPEEFTGIDASIYVLDRSDTGEGKALVSRLGEDVKKVSSAMELEEAVASETMSTGFIIDEEQEILEITWLHNGPVSEREVMLQKARIGSLLEQSGDRTGFRMQTLTDGKHSLSNSLSLLIILLAFEVVVIGYLFAAVMIFHEKQEGLVRAYRVSPGGLFSYVWAKTLVWTTVALVYGLLVVFGSTLFSLPAVVWLKVTAAVILSGLAFTFLGLGIAVYFYSLSEWFVPGVAVLVLNMVPIIAYEMPSLSSWWMEWIPSYPLLFWLKSAFTGTPPSGGGGPLLVRLALWCVIAGVFAFLSVRQKIMKEGR